MTERRGELACAVLAAGVSRRLGSPKQLVLYEDEPLVRRAAGACIGVSRAAVVLGAERDAVASALTGVEAEILSNDRWDEGVASSIRVATEWAQKIGAEALLLHLVDLPLVGGEHLGRLAGAWRAGAPLAGTQFGDVIGAPAIFDRSLFGQLLALSGDRGAGALLRANAETQVVPFAGAAVDVDTPEDVQRLRASRPNAIRR